VAQLSPPVHHGLGSPTHFIIKKTVDKRIKLFLVQNIFCFIFGTFFENPYSESYTRDQMKFWIFITNLVVLIEGGKNKKQKKELVKILALLPNNDNFLFRKGFSLDLFNRDFIFSPGLWY
jgi:hypothetical protein